MATRQPVGQVWIRVSPDTAGFAKETRDRLKSLKSLDNAEVKVKLEIDDDQLNHDFQRAIAGLQKEAFKDAHKVQIQAELTTSRSDMRRQVREQVAAYQALASDQRVDIKTNLDRDGRIAAGQTSPVRLTLDERGFQRDLDKLLRNASSTAEVKIDKKTLGDQVRDLVKTMSDEVGVEFRRAFQKDKLKAKVQVDAESLREAELRMHKIQSYYDGHAEGLSATQRELHRVNHEYADITSKLNRARIELGKINTETKEGAKEYRDLERRMEALQKRQKIWHEERLRLADVARSHHLEIEMNRESVVRAEKQVEELRDRLERTTAEIGVGLDQTSYFSAAARLAALARPRVASIITVVGNMPAFQNFLRKADGASKSITQNLAKASMQVVGIRLLYRTMVDMVRIVPRLDMMIPKLAGVTSGAVAAISAASTALGSVLTIGGDMLKAFNLVYMLPSLLAGAVGSALIIGRAIYDFKSMFPEIISYWKQLGNVVSDRVWNKAAGAVRNLHRAMVPLFNAKVPAWADSWGEGIAALADGLRSGIDSGHLAEFFDNAIEGTKAARRGLEQLGEIIVRTIGIGSRHFPALGTWFSNIMTDFNKWIDRNDKLGNFERWIGDAVQALRDLGSVIWSTGSMFRSLARAASAAGLPSLTDFARGMAGFAETLKSKEFQHGFGGPLENMVGFMNQMFELTPLLNKSLGRLWDLAGAAALELGGPLKGALESILTAFTSGKFQSDMTSFFEDMGTFIEDITPGLGVLVEELGSMASIVGTAAKSWGPAFNEMLLLFQDFGAGIHPGLESFLENTGPALLELVQDIRPELQDASKALGDLLGNEGFQEFVREVLEGLGRIIGLALETITVVSTLAQGFGDWFEGQDEGVQDLIGTMGALALASTVVAGAFMMLRKVFAPVIAVMKGVIWVFRQLGSVVGWLLKQLAKLPGVRVAVNALKGVFESIYLRFLYFLDWLRRLPGMIWRALTQLPGAIGRAFSALGRAIGGAIRGMWSGLGRVGAWLGQRVAALGRTIGGIFRSLPGLIVRGMGSLAGWAGRILAPIGRFFKGLPSAMLRLLPKGGLVRLLGGTLLRVLAGPLGWAWLLTDLLNLIKPVPILDWVGRMLDKMGLGDGFLAGFIDGLSDAFERAFGGDAGLMQMVSIPYNMLVKAWQGAVEGWKTGGLWGAIKGAFAGLGEGILDTFQFTWYGLENLLNAWFPETAPKFFADPWGTIAEWLGLGGKSEAEFLGADASSMSGLATKIRLIFSGLWKNFKGWLNKGFDWLENQLKSWKPTSGAGRFVHDLLSRLRGLLGFDQSGNFSLDTLVRSWKAYGPVLWNKHLKPWLNTGFDWIENQLQSWNPTSGAGQFVHDLLGRLRGLMGFDENGNFSWDTMAHSWKEFGTKIWNKHLKPWLKESWDKLVELIKEWEPVKAVIDFFDDPIGTIMKWLDVPDWLWNEGGTGIIKTSSNPDGGGDSWGTRLWNNHIKPWLERGWDDLVDAILEWEPVETAIDWGGKLEDWIKEGLGLGDEGLWGEGGGGWGGALTNAIFGPDPAGSTSRSLTGTFDGIVPAFKNGLEQGLERLKTDAMPDFGDSEGFMDSLLGVTPSDNARLAERYDAIAQNTKNWAMRTRAEHEQMREVVGQSTSGMRDQIVQYFRDTESGASSATLGMKENTINDYTAASQGGRAQAQFLSTGTIGSFSGMRSQGLAQTGALRAGTISDFIDMTAKARAQSKALFSGVSGNYGSLHGKVLGYTRGIRTGTISDFTGASRGGRSQSQSLSNGVRGFFSSMRTGALSQTRSMRSGTINDFTGTKNSAQSTARQMRDHYVAQMASLARGAMTQANNVRRNLPRALTINASGPGRTTASTYVSGLRSGLSRAAGVARGAASGIRRALSFSAFSSGATVGSTFARGISAKIGAARSAALKLAAAARAPLPQSPAAEGPFSGSGWGGWGESIGEELARGLRAAAPLVAREARSLMGGVHDALDGTGRLSAGVDFESTRRRHGLASDSRQSSALLGQPIYVNVESTSEDPLQDGRRLGGDLAYALKGAGL